MTKVSFVIDRVCVCICVCIYVWKGIFGSEGTNVRTRRKKEFVFRRINEDGRRRDIRMNNIKRMEIVNYTEDLKEQFVNVIFFEKVLCKFILKMEKMESKKKGELNK